MRTFSDLEKFLDKSPHGCWLYTRSTAGSMGYGQLNPDVWGYSRTHVFTWCCHNGPVPTGLEVMHMCDTPLCCNPAHLKLGNRADNLQDMANKGRGRNQHGYCLTAEEVAEMRTYVGEMTHKEIGKIFGIARSTVSNILRGTTRKHLLTERN